MSAPTPEGSAPETGSAENDEALLESARTAPFDLTQLRELVALMESHGLSEVSLKNGAVQWQLRRGPDPASFPHAPPPSPLPVVAPAPAPAAQESAPAAPAAADGLLIKSPTVGTFYSATSPDDPPFVTIGSEVDPETVVCLVEAMKVFNQITADVSGKIAEVLVSNGDSVEFGQPLFRVRAG